MRIVIDEIDHIFYADVILNEQEAHSLNSGSIVAGDVTLKRRKCYIGIRLEGEFDKCEVLEDESDFEGSYD